MPLDMVEALIASAIGCGDRLVAILATKTGVDRGCLLGSQWADRGARIIRFTSGGPSGR